MPGTAHNLLITMSDLYVVVCRSCTPANGRTILHNDHYPTLMQPCNVLPRLAQHGPTLPWDVRSYALPWFGGQEHGGTRLTLAVLCDYRPSLQRCAAPLPHAGVSVRTRRPFPAASNRFRLLAAKVSCHASRRRSFEYHTLGE